MIFILFIIPSLLRADIWTFSSDNDLFFKTDKAYSAAIYLSWIGEEYSDADKDSFTYEYTSTLKDIIQILPFVDLDAKKLNASIGIQEFMITPEDLSQSEPIYDDMAYSGTLGLHFSLFAWEKDEFSQYRMSLGVVGPLSGAKQIQTIIHKITESEEPKGWDNQLDNHGIINFGYLKGFRTYEYKISNDIRFEWFNSMFVDFGNYYIGAGGGSLIRIGQNIPYNFNTTGALMNIDSGGSLNFTSRNKHFGWSASLGMSMNVMGYLYIADVAKEAGYEVDEDKNKLATIKASLGFYYEDVQLSVELYPSRRSKYEDSSSSWGRISLTWHMQ